MPNNENIKYLINLKDNTPKIELSKTDIFQLCQVLFNKLNKEKIDSIVDLESYAQISEWLYLINHNLNLSNNFTLDNLWSVSENMSPECMSSLMYISYCRNHNEFLKFVGGNFSKIATYLKHKTNSYAIYRNEDNKKIHVEYILRISEINKANTSSVERIKTIGKCLPIFEKYCADSIKPLLNVLSVYKTPDDSHKEMPKENVVIMFNQKLNKLWIDTILSNYESDSTDEWIEHWYIIRNLVCDLMDKGARCLYKILSDKPLGSLAIEYDSTKERFDLFYTKEVYYPNEKKPFVKRLAIPEGLSSIKSKYFQSILNYTNQFARQKNNTRPPRAISERSSAKLVFRLNLARPISLCTRTAQHVLHASREKTTARHAGHFDESLLKKHLIYSLINISQVFCDRDNILILTLRKPECLLNHLHQLGFFFLYFPVRHNHPVQLKENYFLQFRTFTGKKTHKTFERICIINVLHAKLCFVIIKDFFLLFRIFFIALCDFVNQFKEFFFFRLIHNICKHILLLK